MHNWLTQTRLIKRWLAAALTGIFLLSAAVPSGADAESIFSYNTGKDYLDMNKDSRDVYVQGVLDQWFLLLAIYDDFDILIWLEECTAGRRSDQMAEQFTDWLEQHPDDLDLTAGELFIAAMIDSCEEPKPL